MTDDVEQGTPTEPATAEQGEQAQAPETGAEQGKPQETAEGQKPAEEAKPKRQGGIEKRISELTAKRREAEQRAADAERRLAEVTAGKSSEADDKAPILDSFDSYDAYVDARAEWVARQTFKAQQREAAEASSKSAAEQRQAVLRDEFAVKVADARERMPDFDAVAFNPNIPVTPAMQDAILESDMSADVAYFLGRNPDVAARLTSLSPMAVAREIGRIEAVILSQPVNVKATSAPDPIKPVGQKPAPVQKSPDEMTEEEYWAWRRTQKSMR